MSDWRDGYDKWKLASPYDDEYDDEDQCDHDDYETDIITGRAECCMCQHSWYLTNEDVNREIERQARYQDDMDRMERRQWWRDRTYPVRMLVHRVLSRVWPRKACSVLSDDEIPF